ncbi:hypothetical protein [Hoyosella altamirensis]|uniref:hypothetical protein n=1 Tax=Hoyosella altamirensis TaxID=616997 RepID=UPI0007DAFA28|nr:hypothetical protein [Hoyosella altamirensis]
MFDRIPAEWRARIYAVVEAVALVAVAWGLFSTVQAQAIQSAADAVLMGSGGIGALVGHLARMHTPRPERIIPQVYQPVHGEGLSAAASADLESRVQELAYQVQDATQATVRTAFAQLPDGARARIQLSVTPER